MESAARTTAETANSTKSKPRTLLVKPRRTRTGWYATLFVHGIHSFYGLSKWLTSWSICHGCSLTCRDRHVKCKPSLSSRFSALIRVCTLSEVSTFD